MSLSCAVGAVDAVIKHCSLCARRLQREQCASLNPAPVKTTTSISHSSHAVVGTDGSCVYNRRKIVHKSNVNFIKHISWRDHKSRQELTQLHTEAGTLRSSWADERRNEAVKVEVSSVDRRRSFDSPWGFGPLTGARRNVDIVLEVEV